MRQVILYIVFKMNPNAINLFMSEADAEGFLATYKNSKLTGDPYIIEGRLHDQVGPMHWSIDLSSVACAYIRYYDDMVRHAQLQQQQPRPAAPPGNLWGNLAGGPNLSGNN